jgi:hypothetical protein
MIGLSRTKTPLKNPPERSLPEHCNEREKGTLCPLLKSLERARVTLLVKHWFGVLFKVDVLRFKVDVLRFKGDV